MNFEAFLSDKRKEIPRFQDSHADALRQLYAEEQEKIVAEEQRAAEEIQCATEAEAQIEREEAEASVKKEDT